MIRLKLRLANYSHAQLAELRQHRAPPRKGLTIRLLEGFRKSKLATVRDFVRQDKGY